MKNIITLIIILAIVVVYLLPIRNDDDNAMRTLKENGYTNIQLKGYYYTGCLKGEIFHTGFVAESPAHQTVEGVVCKGIGMTSTIRYY